MLPPIAPPTLRKTQLVFDVQPVTSRYQWSQFVHIARHLYRGDRRWLPPLASARRDALRPERNPLLRDGDIGPFLGVAANLGLGDESVGTIAAWHTGLHWKTGGGASGAWGLFEAMNAENLAEKLFYEAENWLFEHVSGMVGIRGPQSIEPLTPPGLLTDGFDAEPATYLPYNLPYYAELIEGQGYEPGETWRAYFLDLTGFPQFQPGRRAGPTISRDAWTSISEAYSAQASEGGASLLPGLAEWLSHLAGNASFAFNSAWHWVASRAFSYAISVASGVDQRGPAACFGVPDLASALRASAGHRFPFGWIFFEQAARRSRRLRVFPAVAPDSWSALQLMRLYEDLAARCAAGGYRQAVIAPVPDEDARTSQALEALGARPVQQFTIYEKRF